LCQDIGFSDASTGPGIRSEGGTGCVLSENYSNWYKLVVSQTGTLGLIIRPVTTTDDYDFALYKTTSCASLGSPVRCSYAANTGNTGMDNAQNLAVNTAGCGVANNGSDLSEDVCGNGWVDALTVTLGETYYLLVNNWSPGGNGFTLDWTLTNNASLNCVILPVELLNFSAVPNNDVVDLTWTTASETNNDYFTVERSVDGNRFEPVRTVDGAGTITHERTYMTIDQQPFKGVSYYRLKQTDYDGKVSYSSVVAVKMESGRNFFQVVPNPASGEFTLLFSERSFQHRLIRVLDLSGRVVKEQLIGADDPSTLRFDISGFSGGIYYVSVTDDQVTNTLPLVIR
ncbi:MAG: T9SS type A sorting domain-containing protein, partial [Flavobacteriales bacterium]